jgi:hypothetical protein
MDTICVDRVNVKNKLRRSAYTEINKARHDCLELSPFYEVINKKTKEPLACINFQTDYVKQQGITGIVVEDLLVIAIDRLKEHSEEQNKKAIEKLEEAMMYLNTRRETAGIN